MAIGVAPFALVNHFLLYPLLNIPAGDFPIRYFANMIWLVVLQSQFASLVATTHIGQLVFNSNQSIRKSLKETFRALPTAIWIHGGLRLVFPVMLYYIYIWIYPDLAGTYEFDRAVIEFTLIPLAVGVSLFVRLLRPFVSELMSLEKNRVFNKNTSTISLRKRSGSIHMRTFEMAFRGIVANLFGMMLFFSCFGGILVLTGGIKAYADHTLLVTVFLPVSLWLVATFVFVNRLMNYLDARTLQEGWEVELRLNAEAEHL